MRQFDIVKTIAAILLIVRMSRLAVALVFNRMSDLGLKYPARRGHLFRPFWDLINTPQSEYEPVWKCGFVAEQWRRGFEFGVAMSQSLGNAIRKILFIEFHALAYLHQSIVPCFLNFVIKLGVIYAAQNCTSGKQTWKRYHSFISHMRKPNWLLAEHDLCNLN